MSKVRKIGLSCAALVLCVALAACGGPTVAEYISTIGVGIDSLIAVEAPGWPGAATLNKLFATAETAASNWKAGTPGTDLTQSLNALAAGLDDIPLGTKTDDLIAASVNAIDNLIALVQSEASTASIDSQAAVFMGWIDSGSAAPATPRKHQWKGKPIKSSKDFKAAWNKSAPAPAKIK